MGFERSIFFALIGAILCLGMAFVVTLVRQNATTLYATAAFSAGFSAPNLVRFFRKEMTASAVFFAEILRGGTITTQCVLRLGAQFHMKGIAAFTVLANHMIEHRDSMAYTLGNRLPDPGKEQAMHKNGRIPKIENPIASVFKEGSGPDPATGFAVDVDFREDPGNLGFGKVCNEIVGCFHKQIIPSGRLDCQAFQS